MHSFKMYRSVLIIQTHLLPSLRVCVCAHIHTYTQMPLSIDRPIDGYQREGSSLHCLLNFITHERAAVV